MGMDQRSPHTTLAILFCDKPHCVLPQIKCLNEMELDKIGMKLLVVDVSGNKEEVTKPLREWFDNFKEDFAESEYVEQPQPNQVPTEVPQVQSAETYMRKRWAVAETKDLANKHRVGDFFVIEEDTLCPPKTYKKLKAILRWSDKIGAVTGVNYSRNGNNGMGMNTCWKFQSNRIYPFGDLIPEMRMKVVRVAEKEFGIEPIGSCGNGCMLVRGALMDNYRFMGQSIELGSDGSDVNLGLYITQQRGKYLMVDWSIKTKHLRMHEGKLEALTSLSYGDEYNWQES